MKVIVAGSRSIQSYETVCEAIKLSNFEVTSVVSGCARGADTLGERYARDNKLGLFKFPADWDKHGKSAGFIRNGQMGEFADALIAVWDGESRGTKHMIDYAIKRGLKVYIHKDENVQVPY